MDNLRRKSIDFIRRKSVDYSRRKSDDRDIHERGSSSGGGGGSKKSGGRSVGFCVEGQYLYPGDSTAATPLAPWSHYDSSFYEDTIRGLTLPDPSDYGGLYSSSRAGERSPSSVLG